MANAAHGGSTVWYTLKDAPLSDSFYIAPKNHDKTLYGPVGNATGPRAHWLIAQWNIPAELPQGSSTTPGGWTTQNPHAQVSVDRGKAGDSKVKLTQKGEALACGVEFDVFVSPIDRFTYPGYPEALLSPASADNRPLGGLNSLTLEFDAAELEETVTARCGKSGKVDYGYIVAGIVVGNHRAGQVLYYQILLRDTRASIYQHACDSGTIPWWWSGPVNYGINDTIAAYKSACLAPGVENHYRLGLLERLKQHIHAAPASLNKDLSQWRITGLYVGIGVEGSVTLKAALGGIKLYGEAP
ncbi:hypothetical protein [Methylomagnum sp.]